MCFHCSWHFFHRLKYFSTCENFKIHFCVRRKNPFLNTSKLNFTLFSAHMIKPHQISRHNCRKLKNELIEWINVSTEELKIFIFCEKMREKKTLRARSFHGEWTTFTSSHFHMLQHLKQRMNSKLLFLNKFCLKNISSYTSQKWWTCASYKWENCSKIFFMKIHFDIRTRPEQMMMNNFHGVK